jgi:hypothetical protein
MKQPWAWGGVASGLAGGLCLRHVLMQIGAVETRDQVEALLPWPIRLTEHSRSPRRRILGIERFAT